MNIPISKPYFDETDKDMVTKPLQSGWVVQGPYVQEFEANFSDFTKSTFAVASSNCTTALHLSLVALGIGAGAKVVVPSFTYVASANAIEYTGATPLFCDIDLKNFNIDINHLEALLQQDSSIRAIMPVHLFGLCADMPKIMELAQRYELKVIEDAACGFDAWIDNRHSGTFGDTGCFSFHPRKAISTGEGGMIITNKEELVVRLRSLRDHGASKSDLERHQKNGGSLLPDFNILGYNYRLTDIQGALGVSQLQKAEQIMIKRREIAKSYDEALCHHDKLAIPKYNSRYKHGYQSYVVLFGGRSILEEKITLEEIDRLNRKRNHFMQKLEEKGVATRQGTHAVHTLGYYQNKYQLKKEDYLQSYAADRLSVSLPIYPQMTKEEFEYIVDCIAKVI